MVLRLESNEYHQLCNEILDRDAWKCKHCKYRQNLHVHHIVYRSQGGEDTPENLVTLCSQCHEAIHNGNLGIFGNEEGRFMFERYNNWRPQ